MSDRRYGILIASSRFPNEPKLEDLRCPENDVDGLNEVLSSKVYGQFTNTFLLKNVPNHEALLKINDVLRKASKNDLVLIYYSGHGKLNPAGRLHLCATNTIVSTLEATSIPVSTIKEYVDISPSNKVVLVLDCCYGAAADAAFARSSVDDQLHLVSGGRGTYIMTASTGIQVALEKESDQYGIFTKHIIEGIREGKADIDDDGRITMAELYTYVHDKVLEESPQEPTKCDLNVRGELVIARSSKTPREKRRKEIRKKLFDLAAEGILPDDILDKARQVLAMEPTQLSKDLQTYDDLLEQFRQERMVPVAFIRKWDKVGSKRPRSIPEPPRLVEPEIITIPEKLIDFGEIKAGSSYERTLQIQNKGGGELKWSYEKSGDFFDVSRAGDSLKVTIRDLEAGTWNGQLLIKSNGGDVQIEVRANVVVPSKKAEDGKKRIPGWLYGAGALIVVVLLLFYLSGEKHEPPVTVTEPEIVSTKTGRLFVETEPGDARVKILNIGPKFYQGIELEPGRYHVEVSAMECETERRWVELGAGEDKYFEFRLKKIRVAESIGPSGKSFTNSIGMKFVLIPAGSFMMGSPSYESERYGNERQHRVTISKPFYMQTTEVTQVQWQEVMGKNPSYFSNCGDDCPVERVSWYKVQEFIRKLNQKERSDNYRLPTEAEWEYACRARREDPFFFGKCLSTDLANYNGNYPMPECEKGEYRYTTIRVGSFPPNAWGLHDMHGNVCEWCQDWYWNYPGGHVTDPKGPLLGSGRVFRGGSWILEARHCRSAIRGRNFPGNRGEALGFRLARTP
ncbi:MAG: SUMF1/EgtB/PvdO family nonheme iron enzyme [Deltaproteobacteria bacterium]|nr:SUMF1/EgtB/PvdO family nonheme iron enzyme [Deltaproteobacteria bacterium]